MPFRPSAVSLKGLTSSSHAWLSRQFRDPFVKQRLSHPDAYRSRSAFKLLELNEKWHRFLERPDVAGVVDLGAAPGGWSQVVAGKLGWTERVEAPPPRKRADQSAKLGNLHSWSNAAKIEGGDPAPLDGTDGFSRMPTPRGRGTIVAVDLLPITPIPGVRTIQADFLSPKTGQLIKAMLTSPQNREGKADVILADMAANITGNRITDSAASLELCSAVFRFASENLRTANSIGRRRGGVLLLKHFTHPLLQNFRVECLNPNFIDVHYIKPAASRAASREGYWLCQGWKGVSAES